MRGRVQYNNIDCLYQATCRPGLEHLAGVSVRAGAGRRPPAPGCCPTASRKCALASIYTPATPQPGANCQRCRCFWRRWRICFSLSRRGARSGRGAGLSSFNGSGATLGAPHQPQAQRHQRQAQPLADADGKAGFIRRLRVFRVSSRRGRQTPSAKQPGQQAAGGAAAAAVHRPQQGGDQQIGAGFAQLHRVARQRVDGGKHHAQSPPVGRPRI